MLFPVSAIVFSRVTFAGLALNFLAIPMMGVAQIAGMLVLPAAIVSSDLAFLAGWVAHAGAAGLVWSADLVRFVPAVTYRIAPPSWGAVGIYYVALAACVGAMASTDPIRQRGAGPRRAWARRVASAAAIGAAAWILVPVSLFAREGDGRLHVTFLDVGQGDSALLRFPRGATMLVDAGGVAGAGSFDIGDRVVAPVLRDAGLRQLDYLVLTHGDPDHIGGAAAIIRRVPSSPGLGGDFSPIVPPARVTASSGAVGRMRSGRTSTAAAGSSSTAWRYGRFIRRRLTGNGRRCGTTTRSRSNCGGATCRCCSPGTSAGQSRASWRGTSSRRQSACSRCRTTAVSHRAARRSCRRSDPQSRSSAPAAPTTSATPHRRCCSGTGMLAQKLFRTDQDGAVTRRHRWAFARRSDFHRANVSIAATKPRNHEVHEGHEAMTVLRLASHSSRRPREPCARDDRCAVSRCIESLGQDFWKRSIRVRSPSSSAIEVSLFDEKTIPIRYREVVICHQRIDLLVDNRLVLEVKSVERLRPIHVAQVINYLRITGVRVGLAGQFQRARPEAGNPTTRLVSSKRKSVFVSFVSSWCDCRSTDPRCRDFDRLPLLFQFFEAHLPHRSPGFGDRRARAPRTGA